MLLLICVVPLTILLAYLLIMTNKISSEYDGIVRRITKANAYNINFKEDMDYVMYIIVVNSERAEELVDTEQPHRMIQAAREVFGELYEEADSEYAANRLSSILKSLDTLEDRVEEIEKDALVTGLYETNMERLDLNIRVLTELIQEQIQYYIYEHGGAADGNPRGCGECHHGDHSDSRPDTARGMDGQQEDCAGHHGAHPAAV